MSHTTKRVLFRHNRAIKTGISQRQEKRDALAKKRGKKKDGWKTSKRTNRVRRDGILDKDIQDYRMWFLFLKLALELEQQGTVLILKDRRKREGGTLTKAVKVNHERYKKWDLKQVLTSSFDKWWDSHRNLFLDEGIKILSPTDSIVESPNHLYLRIDTRRRASDIVKGIRQHLKQQDHHKTQGEFPINGNPRHLVLMNKYNALVLKLKGYPDKYILSNKNGFMRLAHAAVKKEGGYSLRDAGRTMFDLLSGSKKSFGAKQILLSVCDGYFVKNPHTNYLE